MILHRNKVTTEKVENCHDGHGLMWSGKLLEDFHRAAAGFTFIHDNVIEPGASIGEHRHDGTEEIYVILTGRGVMKMDGVDQEVVAGDVALTRSGHRHSLTNSLEGPMHFLVIGLKV